MTQQFIQRTLKLKSLQQYISGPSKRKMIEQFMGGLIKNQDDPIVFARTFKNENYSTFYK